MNMISVTAAKQIIKAHLLQTAIVSLPLAEALHLRLANSVFSPVNVPAFTQSSMDGYAFNYADWQPGHSLFIQGQMQAGSSTSVAVKPGQAVRIFTGAPLPAGTDTVVMQEKTKVSNSELLINDEKLEKGTNARSIGSAIKAGDLALEKNSFLIPGAIGFLAGMGISHVQVYGSPSIAIIVTGDELRAPGTQLAYGEVHESNAVTLQAVLAQQQLRNIKIYHAADEPAAVKKILAKALDENEMVLLTGGVSVGEYDFVVQAAAACGVQQQFHKIKQRPGKPLYFGTKNQQLVFGLPGNPSSVLTCFYEYVLLALQKELPVIHIPLAKDCKKAAGLTHFLKAWYDGKTVTPLDAQESYRMSSFAKANCLVQLDEETIFCPAGEPAEIHLLPF